ncbi:MAG TPA: hypothetical protein VMW19_00500 [Myxococcota bacterium]|nr:hypothetical protein [Myxococcota bacterium]
MAEIEAERLSELQARVAEDPAAPGFAALAELHRRARRFLEAERVLRAGLDRRGDANDARALLALVLWDQGRDDEARGELSRIGARILAARAAAAADDAALSDAELEVAFAEAETDADALIDPDRVAAEAIERADAGAHEGLREDAEAADVPGQAFVTETMARLLDRQGDARGAARIRAALAAENPPPRDRRRMRVQQRARTVAVLERWLANLRRDWA